MSATIEALTILGPVGATAVVTAFVCLRYGRKNGNGNGKCPIPEHVATLAIHTEAIGTLKEGQTLIFNKLDDLPQKVAEAVKAKR